MWEHDGTGKGIVTVRAGAGEPISAAEFGKWLAGKEDGGLVAVTTTDGELTTLTRIDAF